MVTIAGQGQEDEDLKGHLYLDLPKTYTKTVDGSGNPIAQDTNIRSLDHSEKDGGTTGSLPSGMQENQRLQYYSHKAIVLRYQENRDQAEFLASSRIMNQINDRKRREILGKDPNLDERFIRSSESSGHKPNLAERFKTKHAGETCMQENPHLQYYSGVEEPCATAINGGVAQGEAETRAATIDGRIDVERFLRLSQESKYDYLKTLVLQPIGAVEKIAKQDKKKALPPGFVPPPPKPQLTKAERRELQEHQRAEKDKIKQTKTTIKTGKGEDVPRAAVGWHKLAVNVRV